MKKSNTQKALLTSAFALLMCVAMLVGTTFAWFTDTASTSVNKVQAGTLKVALEMWDGEKWVDAEGTTLNFKAADGNTEILWEPGCTYDLPLLRIKNNGNLAIKYQVLLTGINGDAKLNEAIEWRITTPVGDWGTLSGVMAPGYNSWEGNPILSGDEEGRILQITGHMKEDAGNEYQGLSIEGISITVVATQTPNEFDSNSDQYDKDAVYPNSDIVIASSNDAKTGLTIRENITYASNSITHSFDNTVTDAIGISVRGTSANVTLNDVDMDVKQNVAINGTLKRNFSLFVYNGASLTINSGNYTIDGSDVYFLWVQNGSNPTNSKVTINGGTFISNSNGPLLAAYSVGSVLEINGGFFDQSAGNENLTIQGGALYGKGTVIVKGGTFVDFNPQEHVAEGYKVVSETQSNGHVYYSVVKAN